MTTASPESITRFVQLTPALVTSGQPTEAQLSALPARGLEYVHIPVQFGSPTNADFQRFFAAMDFAGTKKV